MNRKPVDAHCHLDFKDFDKDREEIIKECREKLEFVVNAGRETESNNSSLELQEKYSDFIYAAAGIHPTHTDSFDQVEEVKQQVRDNEVHAVGEIGMDYHHVESKDLRERQREVFVEMVELAEEHDLPVVVHSRNAEKQVIDILEDRNIDAYLHCFNGSVEQLERALENDMMIGVTYQIDYSSRVHEIVERIELSNLLLETDSPFLYRGGRNNPENVEVIAEKVADIKSVSVSKVKNQTTENAERFFGL